MRWFLCLSLTIISPGTRMQRTQAQGSRQGLLMRRQAWKASKQLHLPPTSILLRLPSHRQAMRAMCSMLVLRCRTKVSRLSGHGFFTQS